MSTSDTTSSSSGLRRGSLIDAIQRASLLSLGETLGAPCESAKETRLASSGAIHDELDGAEIDDESFVGSMMDAHASINWQSSFERKRSSIDTTTTTQPKRVDSLASTPSKSGSAKQEKRRRKTVSPLTPIVIPTKGSPASPLCSPEEVSPHTHFQSLPAESAAACTRRSVNGDSDISNARAEAMSRQRNTVLQFSRSLDNQESPK